MGKRINATFYAHSKFVYTRKEGFRVVYDPDGYLYSDGTYRTKMLPEDLPEWFVEGRVYKHHGYVSAKGVKHLVYIPNYFVDYHMYKDDALYISYNERIERRNTHSMFDWEGYDHLIWGNMIVRFVEAAEKYSGYDVTDIRVELERKKEWYFENNPGEAALYRG